MPRFVDEEKKAFEIQIRRSVNGRFKPLTNLSGTANATKSAKANPRVTFAASALLGGSMAALMRHNTNLLYEQEQETVCNDRQQQ